MFGLTFSIRGVLVAGEEQAHVLDERRKRNRGHWRGRCKIEIANIDIVR